MQDSSSFNVRDFGAVGDGATKATLAIQKAIDTCAQAGGGRVILPAGRFLSGTIFLKSHVEFHLSAGATLLGSGDRADYNADDVFPENGSFSAEQVTGAHLVIAYKQENVSITGHGTIDGHSSEFFKPLPEGTISTYRHKGENFEIKDWRPGQMVFFCRCQNVRVQDVSLINTPYWTLFLLGCEDVRIRGLKIENPPATRNGDGIDIDCCRFVTVSDCIIRSGDDSITLRANNRLLGGKGWPCENVVVTNCVLSTPCNAIRVGVGDGEIRRCSFNNIIVTETSRAISIICRYATNINSHHGATIEDVHFSDFTIDACMAFSIHVGPEAARPAAIRNVSFSRFNILTSAGSNMIGLEQTPLEDIRLLDFYWHVKGGTDNTSLVNAIPEDFPKYGLTGLMGAPSLPCLLYGRHIHGATMENMRVRWENPSAVWREGIRMDRCQDIEMNNVKVPPPPARNEG